MNAPIEVYFWLTPNAWKVTIALEEMKIPYVTRPVAIGRGDQFKSDFLRISPNNKVPAIVDPDGPGGLPISVFESGAILRYLGRKSGLYYPDDERIRTSVDSWLFWQVGGIGPMFGQSSHFRIYAPNLTEDPTQLAYSVRRYDNEVNRLLGVMEKRLATHRYLAGEYSIADMAVFPWVSMSEKLGQSLESFGAVSRWMQSIAARPAVQRGMAAGGEIPAAQPDPGSAERRQFDRTLFGQTAASVAAASAESTAAS